MRLRNLLLTLLITALIAVPTLALGQDSGAVVPTAPVPGGTGLCGLIAPYQLALVQLISAGLLFAMSSIWAGFASAGDWTKRLAAFIAGTLVSLGLTKLGCTVSTDTSALGPAALQGLLASVINWLMFKVVKNQPSTSS